MRGIDRIEQFEEQVEYFVDVAADYAADFVVFPELYTLELLSIDKNKLPPEKAILKIADYTERYLAFMEKRSEEHTSELQSLMRISYAVFCLKKKTPYSHDQSTTHHT